MSSTKDNPTWLTDYKSLVHLVSDYFIGGSGDTVTLYEVEKFLRAYFHPMQSRISELEAENQKLRLENEALRYNYETTKNTINP